VKVAEYSCEDEKLQFDKMRNIIGYILIGFGIFMIISAFSVFPSNSSWGGIYAIIGSIVLSIGIYQKISKFKYKVLCTIGSFLIIIMCLFAIDYVGVSTCKQAPRFCYEKISYSEEILYKTPFYSVTGYNVGKANEYYEIN
jgi:hypothetical protein